MKHFFVVLLLICALSQVVKCQYDEYIDYDFMDPDYDEDTQPIMTPTRRPTQRPTNRPRPVPMRPRPIPPTTIPPIAVKPKNPGVDGNGQLIGCPCLTTHETNRVCGTDGNTYGNMGKLKCAQRCGHPVELNYLGRCTKKPN